MTSGNDTNLQPFDSREMPPGTVVSLADLNREWLPAGYTWGADGITRPDGSLATPEHLSDIGFGRYTYTGYPDRAGFPVFSELDPDGEISHRDVVLAVSGRLQNFRIVAAPLSSIQLPPAYSPSEGYLATYEQSKGPFQQRVDERHRQRQSAPRTADGRLQVPAIVNTPLQRSAPVHTLTRQRGIPDLRTSSTRQREARFSRQSTEEPGRDQGRGSNDRSPSP